MKNKKIKQEKKQISAKFAKKLLDEFMTIIFRIAESQGMTDINDISNFVWNMSPEEFKKLKLN